ncbi:MAG: chemotaxis protein CheW [Pseudomonadota bacterium]
MAEDNTLSFGVVRIGGTAIGIPLDNLSEVFHSRVQQALPIHSDQLQGGIDLRGNLIPVLNMSLIGNFPNCNTDPKLGVVLEQGQMSLAIYVDEIVGIANTSGDQIGRIVRSDASEEAFFASVFPFNDVFVSILDVSRVFKIPGVFSASRSAANVVKATRKGPPMLTFTAGGALYSVPAIEVHAAVPRQEIRQTAITSGPCLGEITYHNRRIPVICPVSILGLGKRYSHSLSEVVVLRFVDDLLLGIAVDAIREIRTFSTASEKTIPIAQMGLDLIEKVLIQDDGKQIFVVDVAQLRDTETVLNIAKLSRMDAEKQVEQPKNTADEAVGSVVRERERYLVVDLHKRIAIPLLEVTCILDQPKNLTPVNANADGFLGYFSRRGETVALIDLREHLGAGPVKHKKAQVLMTGEPGRQFGFLVDDVVGIEVSQWRSTQQERGLTAEEPIVKLGSGKATQILPCVGLATISGSFAEIDASNGMPDLPSEAAGSV